MTNKQFWLGFVAVVGLTVMNTLTVLTRKAKIMVTTNVEIDLWELAKKKGIAWNDALAVGIKSLAKQKKK